MAAPNATDVYSFLEGYCIDNTIISEAWINNRINKFIIPWIEKKTRLSFSTTVKQITEYYSGQGERVLFLNRKPVLSIDDYSVIGQTELVDLAGNLELYAESGILLSKNSIEGGSADRAFPRGDMNIKITYSYGYNDFTDPVTGELVDIKEAIVYMAASRVLTQAGARTGGGNIGGQAWSRQFGEQGKYTEIIKMCDRDALVILSEYMTGVTG